MEVSAAGSATAATPTNVPTAMLKKTNDLQKEIAAQLIQSLPPPPPPSSGRGGQRLDIYA